MVTFLFHTSFIISSELDISSHLPTLHLLLLPGKSFRISEKKQVYWISPPTPTDYPCGEPRPMVGGRLGSHSSNVDLKVHFVHRTGLNLGLLDLHDSSAIATLEKEGLRQSVTKRYKIQ